MKRSAVAAGIGLFVLIALVAGGLTLLKMNRREGVAPSFEPPMAVVITPSRSAMWQPTSDLVGTVIALRSVTVQNEVEGRVRSVGFASGDIVEPGQVLVTLDDSTDQAELRNAQASLRVAQADVLVVEARVRLAESEFRMQQSAAESRATSIIEVDRARAELERYKAEVERAKASVDEAESKIGTVQTRLDKHVIKAPFRARVGLRSVHEGQFLAQQMGSQDAPIATLQEVSDKIYIDFAVPQEYLSRVRVGTIVTGVQDSVDGGEPRVLRLEVSAIDATANNETRNVRVRSIVDNTEQLFRPGMFVKIRVPVDEARSFVVVPVTAVRRASYADQVFVIKTMDGKGLDGAPTLEMRASQRFVKLGPTIGDDVIVLDGLAPGEQVATSGSFKLREGALVMPAAPAAIPPDNSGPAVSKAAEAKVVETGAPTPK